jgi:hypothetical protein
VSFAFAPAYIALWAFVLFQGILILGLLIKLENLRQLIERGGTSLPIGSRAPEFLGVDQAGEPVGLEDVAGGIVLFLSPDCSACNALVDSIASASGNLPRTVVVCRGEEEACAGLSVRLRQSVQVIVDRSGQITSAYGTSSFPRAVVVDSKKTIRRYGHPRTSDDLKEALEESLAETEKDNISAGELSLNSAQGTEL